MNPELNTFTKFCIAMLQKLLQILVFSLSEQIHTEDHGSSQAKFLSVKLLISSYPCF